MREDIPTKAARRLYEALNKGYDPESKTQTVEDRAAFFGYEESAEKIVFKGCDLSDKLNIGLEHSFGTSSATEPEITGNIPESVRVLRFDRCDYRSSVETNLGSAEQIYFTDCNLIFFPKIPEQTEILSIDGCKGFSGNELCYDRGRQITFGEQLKEILITNCATLSSLPEIPAGVKFVNIENCPLLKTNSALLENLLELMRNGVEVATDFEEKLAAHDLSTTIPTPTPDQTDDDIVYAFDQMDLTPTLAPPPPPTTQKMAKRSPLPPIAGSETPIAENEVTNTHFPSGNLTKPPLLPPIGTNRPTASSIAATGPKKLTPIPKR